MSKYIDIKGVKYLYEVNYKNNEVLRNSFNNLAERTFGINFEQWYKDGYWGDKYITYSLIDNKAIVSNVSVSIMDFLVLGERKTYIQIGTVMTDSEYRGRGLSSFLMKMIIEEWEEKSELIYLFANDSAINFYPKFNFVTADEYECSIDKFEISKCSMVRKINMDNVIDKGLVTNIVESTKIFSKIASLNNTSLVMFYCSSFMKEDIYYIEEYNAIVIAKFNESNLYIKEVFGTEEVDLNNIINAMVTPKINKVVLGFTPNDTLGYKEELLKEEDTTLFVKEGKSNLLHSNKLRFPSLSHA